MNKRLLSLLMIAAMATLAFAQADWNKQDQPDWQKVNKEVRAWKEQAQKARPQQRVMQKIEFEETECDFLSEFTIEMGVTSIYNSWYGNYIEVQRHSTGEVLQTVTYDGSNSVAAVSVCYNEYVDFVWREVSGFPYQTFTILGTDGSILFEHSTGSPTDGAVLCSAYATAITTCATPSINAPAITGQKVALSWNGHGESNWDYILSEKALAANELTKNIKHTSSNTLSETLNYGEARYLYVRSNCGGGEVSKWASAQIVNPITLELAKKIKATELPIYRAGDNYLDELVWIEEAGVRMPCKIDKFVLNEDATVITSSSYGPYECGILNEDFSSTWSMSGDRNLTAGTYYVMLVDEYHIPYAYEYSVVKKEAEKIYTDEMTTEVTLNYSNDKAKLEATDNMFTYLYGSGTVIGDVYKFTIDEDTTVQVRVASDETEPQLVLDSVLTFDKMSGSPSSYMNEALKAGTYYVGVFGGTSLPGGKLFGSYSIDICYAPAKLDTVVTAISVPHKATHAIEKTDFWQDGVYNHFYKFTVPDTAVYCISTTSKTSLVDYSLYSDSTFTNYYMNDTLFRDSTYYLSVYSMQPCEYDLYISTEAPYTFKPLAIGSCEHLDIKESTVQYIPYFGTYPVMLYSITPADTMDVLITLKNNTSKLYGNYLILAQDPLFYHTIGADTERILKTLDKGTTYYLAVENYMEDWHEVDLCIREIKSEPEFKELTLGQVLEGEIFDGIHYQDIDIDGTDYVANLYSITLADTTQVFFNIDDRAAKDPYRCILATDSAFKKVVYEFSGEHSTMLLIADTTYYIAIINDVDAEDTYTFSVKTFQPKEIALDTKYSEIMSPRIDHNIGYYNCYHFTLADTCFVNIKSKTSKTNLAPDIYFYEDSFFLTYITSAYGNEIGVMLPKGDIYMLVCIYDYVAHDYVYDDFEMTVSVFNDSRVQTLEQLLAGATEVASLPMVDYDELSTDNTLTIGQNDPAFGSYPGELYAAKAYKVDLAAGDSAIIVSYCDHDGVLFVYSDHGKKLYAVEDDTEGMTGLNEEIEKTTFKAETDTTIWVVTANYSSVYGGKIMVQIALKDEDIIPVNEKMNAIVTLHPSKDVVKAGSLEALRKALGNLDIELINASDEVVGKVKVEAEDWVISLTTQKASCWVSSSVLYEMGYIVENLNVIVDIEIISTIIEQVAENATEVTYSQFGRIYVHGADKFRIYDLAGRDVTCANGSLKGIYIVRTENQVHKIVVK